MRHSILSLAFIFTSYFSFAQIDLSGLEPKSNYTESNAYIISNVWASARKNLRNIKEILAAQNYNVSAINPRDISQQYVFSHPTQKSVEVGEGQTATVKYKIQWVQGVRVYTGFYMSADLVLDDGTVYRIQDVKGMEELWQPFAAMIETLPGAHLPIGPEEAARVKIVE